MAIIERALPLLSTAAGSEVDAIVGDPTALTAIEDALNTQRYDESMLSTLPTHLSRWQRLDLPSKAAGFGLP